MLDRNALSDYLDSLDCTDKISPFLFVHEDNSYSPSGYLDRPCYITVPQAYKENDLAFVLPRNFSKSNLNKQFLEYLIGEESPWFTYKDLLFPDNYSFESKFKQGIVFENLGSLPCNLLINFSKAYRGIGEHSPMIKKWAQFVELGATKRQAHFLAHMFHLYEDNLWMYVGLYHSCFDCCRDYSSNQFKRISLALPDSSKLSKTPDHHFSFVRSSMDSIWNSDIDIESKYPNDFNSILIKRKVKAKYGTTISYDITSEELTEFLKGLNDAS